MGQLDTPGLKALALWDIHDTWMVIFRAVGLVDASKFNNCTYTTSSDVVLGSCETWEGTPRSLRLHVRMRLSQDERDSD
jgi:hypothetical protein